MRLIEITGRLCSGKLQPGVRVGARAFVRREDRLRDGTRVLVLASPEKEGKTLRVNAKRFQWREITMDTLLEERRERETRRDQELVRGALTLQEKARVAIVPVMLDCMALRFASVAAEKAASYRLAMMKRVTREVREIMAEYGRAMSSGMERGMMDAIRGNAERFMEEYSKDFTVLYFSVNQELKRKCPSYPYDDLRTSAIMAKLLIRLSERYGREAFKAVARATGKSRIPARLPLMGELERCMDAYAAEMGRFDYADRNVLLSMRVIENHVNGIEFGVEGEDNVELKHD